MRRIFDDFVTIGSTTTTAKTYVAEGLLSKVGKPLTKQAMYKMLHNRMYLGEINHRGQSYPGEHQAIITQAQWDAVHALIETDAPQRKRVVLGDDGLEIVWRDLGWQELAASLLSGTIGAELQELEAEEA
ncbi:hypothetical protein FACS1894116_04940 [Betaproteobacteria bacterium]|nr:hypothetical protein FACS1894116_04940 [Betaproteobacteria bacterium]GHT97529.1 hypothetical protein FACS1894154_01110 [Betaproteobacteria bacterium]GHU22021.1 hypothetical protein FACS189488_01740 [Betaproteobacteria bacterium]